MSFCYDNLSDLTILDDVNRHSCSNKSEMKALRECLFFRDQLILIR